jgi:hypothetical protein
LTFYINLLAKSPRAEKREREREREREARRGKDIIYIIFVKNFHGAWARVRSQSTRNMGSGK